MASDVPTQDGRLRARYSLLTLLLTTAIVALSTTVIVLWREIGPLRAENKRFNEERGTLVINDPGVLHAIKIPERYVGDSGDSYRIYVPEGQEYLAWVQVNSIPKQGYPQLVRQPRPPYIMGGVDGRPFAGLRAGEHIVSVRVERHASRADVVLETDSETPMNISADSPKEGWPTEQHVPYGIYDSGVEGATTRVRTSGRLVLLRRRIEPIAETMVNPGYATFEPDHPLDGMMLWLERVK